MPKPSLIELVDITKSFQGKEPIFSEVSTQIAKGEFIFLTGISGAGKSTVFRLLLGLESPDSGEILFNRRNVTQLPPTEMNVHRRTIGMVFQDYKLLQKKTAEENIEIPLLIQGISKKKRVRQLQQIGEKLGIQRLMRQPIMSLSGGEKQLIAIARAAVHSPKAILADEPTANLDQKTAGRIMSHLLRLHEEGATVVIATHDINLIRSYETRILLIKNAKIHEVE